MSGARTQNAERRTPHVRTYHTPMLMPLSFTPAMTTPRPLCALCLVTRFTLEDFFFCFHLISFAKGQTTLRG